MVFQGFKARSLSDVGTFYGNLSTIDEKRVIAVYVRQSDKNADDKNGESRETQLKLVEYAKKLLGLASDDETELVRLYDEGAGKSGQKRIDERPELNRLYGDLRNGMIGTVIVAREDRLFRDKHLDQVGMFTKLAEDKMVIIIVPPLKDGASLKLYNFAIYEHLKSFQEKMRIAYDFIEYHIGYMHANQRNKAARGGYDGRPLVPGLVIPKYVDKADRIPVIYEPWADTMRWVYRRLKELDWNIPQLNREIDKLPYLFKEPSEEDRAKCIFKNRMNKHIGGYKPGDPDTIRQWLTNVSLIGWWLTDKKTGEVINNLPVIIEKDLFEEGFIKMTGYDLEGMPVKNGIKKRQVTRVTRNGKEAEALLHGILEYNHEEKVIPTNVVSRYGRKSSTYYLAHKHTKSEIYENTVFAFPASLMDDVVADRLRCLTKSDKNIAQRIEKKLQETMQQQEKACVSINDAIAALNLSIELLKTRLKTLNQKSKGTPDEEEIINDVFETMQSKVATREELKEKKRKMGVIEGMEEVREFYDILDDFDTYWSGRPLEKKKKFISLMIEKAEIRTVGMHWLELYIEWFAPLANRPDKCLIWSYNARKTPMFTDEVDDIIRMHYPSATSVEMAQLLPDRSWNAIQERAWQLRIKKNTKQFNVEGYGENSYSMTWLDIAPDGRFLFGTQRRTIKIIGEILKTLKDTKKKLYPLWLIPASLDDLPLSLRDSHITLKEELVNPYPEFTGADWDSRVHVDVIPTNCTIEVDGHVIMRDGQFTL